MTRKSLLACLSAIWLIAPSTYGQVTWVGGDATNPTFWDEVTVNWTGAFTTYLNGDAVTFDDTATTFDVEIQAPLTPGSITFNNTVNTYTLTGNTLTGNIPFNLSANSSVILALNGDTNYTGVTTIGTGATLQVGTGPTSNANLFGLGSVVNNGTFILDRLPNSTEGIALELSGSGDVLVRNGNLALLSANTYTGSTTIEAGAAIEVRGVTTALGAASAGTVVGAGGTVFLDNVSGTMSEPFTLNGGGINARTTGEGSSAVDIASPITIGAGGNAFLTLAGETDVDMVSNGMTVSGPITGSSGSGLNTTVGSGSTMILSGGVSHNGSLSKAGAGTLQINGAYSYTGDTTVTGGTLDIRGSGATTLTSASGQALIGGNGALNGDAVVQSGATLRIGADTLTGETEPPTVGPVTYIDAEFTGGAANTTLADGTAMVPVAAVGDADLPEEYVQVPDALGNPAGDPVEARWQERPRGAANGGSVFVAPTNFVENFDVPIIKTTISGLTPGADYGVFGFYFGRNPGGSGDGWDIEFGLTEGGLEVFGDPNDKTGVLASELTFVADPNFEDAGGVIPLLQGSLGTQTASASGTIEVFVNDGPSIDRSWYEGVGYATITAPPDGFIDNIVTFTVDGDLTLDSGSTAEFELLATNVYDKLDVTGLLTVGGALDVSLAPGADSFIEGDTFDILDFGSISGMFDSLNLPGLDSGLAWDTSALLTTGVLEVVASIPLTGDYNNDGVVDAADYTVWRDGDSPDSSQAGYDAWANNYGATASSASVAVPEPSAIALLALGLCALVPASRR